MTADFSELNRLAADLSHAGVVVSLKIRPALERSAERIEQQAKEFAPRKRLPHYAETINHDVTTDGSGHVVAEIGPDRSVNGQAKLANIFEYGTSDQAPRAHLGPALDREGPNFVAAVKEIGGDVL